MGSSEPERKMIMDDLCPRLVSTDASTTEEENRLSEEGQRRD